MARLQFDMPDAKVKELDALVERLGLKTRAQLINAALTLFKWTVQEREAGRMVASVDEDRGVYKEILMAELPDRKIQSTPAPVVSEAGSLSMDGASVKVKQGKTIKAGKNDEPGND